MKLLGVIATISLIATSAVDITAANAKPFVYTSLFADGRTYEECLKSAESTLKSRQFKDLEIDNSNENVRAVSISGYHENEYVTVEVECDQSLGVTSLAVAGIDNEFTYKIYRILYDALVPYSPTETKAA